MNDNGIRHGIEGTETSDMPDFGAAYLEEYEAFLDERCYSPGCERRNRDHSPEQAEACRERHLAMAPEAGR